LTAAAQGVAATCEHEQEQEQEGEEEEETKKEDAWMHHHSDSFHRRDINTKGLQVEGAAASAGKTQTTG
jgi:hypothetical protein